MAVIYRITNMANNKFYVGSADSFARREWQHKYHLRRNEHKNPHLQAAWNKYGEEMFVFEVLETIPEGENQLVWEDKWLRECVGKDDCYNVNTLASAPRLGIVLSEVAKQNISEGRKGKHGGANHYRYGQTISEDVRKKIGDAQRGKPKKSGRKISYAGMEKIRAAAEAGHYSHWEGRNHTEESKDKMRRPLVGVDPSGVRHEYTGTKLAGEALGIAYTMLVRVIKDGGRVAKGKLAGWQFFYADKEPKLFEVPDEFKHLPRTRQQAKEQGAKEYFTGVACTHGHISPRLTKGTCVACRKAGLG